MAAIGIDLGTTNSCVAVYRHGSVEIIANDRGHSLTPSCVAFTDAGRLVGEAAISQLAVDPRNTLYDIKRLIGRRMDDPTLQDDLQRLPFEVSSDGGRPRIHVRYRGEEKVFSPEEISSQVVAKMRQTAETYLGQEVRNVVLTVPAHFNDSQRQATMDAGTIAGLHVLRTINEPSAAALAYGFHRILTTEQRIVIFDLSGGTLDVSVLTIDKRSSLFEVKSTAGDTHLGGNDFDNRLAEYLAQDFRSRHLKTFKRDAKSWRRLLAAAELAKRALSSSAVATVTIDALHAGIDYSVEVSRERFEELCADLFQAMLKPLERALAESQLERDRIDEIVLVGGATRIPKIQSLLRTFFHGKEPNLSINPDEAVAYGAAVQAAMLAGTDDAKLQGCLLQDVTAFSLGVELAGGTMTSVIERNTTIPCRRQQTFSTHVDNQATVDVAIFEGERPGTQDSNLLGRFLLTGISPAASGAPEIIVTFDIDANGILEVSAKEERSGRSRNIAVEGEKRNLSSAEVQRMLADAERFRREDDDARNCAQARNRLESHCFALQTAASYGQLPDEQCKRVRKATQCVLSWLDKNPDASYNEYESQHQIISASMATASQQNIALEPIVEEAE